ncbi:alpha/beta fold hydrolase [Alicyclobacillus fodiniaquatilis]|jgi:pimeloyl-ACP methyl ester carboxylesterase|uniref:Alpha/beta fold hydrolase n=1 Tax=Alicyclobacillus fodiniaquatilis TaxID=1661150 RepID=A0ABW4JN68_9BACL
MFDGVIEVRNGRKVGYAEYGPKGGYPVVLFHGTPGSRFQVFAHLATRELQEVSIIVPERPGYGLSDVQHQRSLFDHAADIQTLVTHLGIQRFSVIGISGGAPYALACAKALPECIERVSILCGVGPLNDPELLVECDELEQALIARSKAADQYIAQMVAAAQHAPEAVIQQIYASLPPTDQALISKDMLSVLLDTFLEGLCIPDGMVDDYIVLAKPWDFSLHDIQAPVHLWHSTADHKIGIRHAEYIASQVPNAVLHKISNIGHIGTPFACIQQVLNYIRTGAVATM